MKKKKSQSDSSNAAAKTTTPAISKPTTNLKSNASYIKRLKTVINKQTTVSKSSVTQNASLAAPGKNPKFKNTLLDDARQRLESARFRYLNEKLYTRNSSEAWQLFQEDPESFDIYHKGFKNQVVKWPVNPLDIIITELLKGPESWIVADFGCGEARLAQTIPNHVHSFDLVAANDKVTACDMAKVPLTPKAVDVAVFCLSLMGSNVNDFLKEANRVLKIGGVLYVAEVESRCNNIQDFLKAVEKFGFKLGEKQAHKYFFLAKFSKIKNLSPKATLPRINLKPCLYKKR